MWGPILEKAIAKVYGNFEHTQGGAMGKAVRLMTGAPFERHWHEKSTLDVLWKELQAHESMGDIIMTASNATNTSGLAAGHAFTVLGTRKLSTGQRLV